jgi:hypothetical protein
MKNARAGAIRLTGVAAILVAPFTGAWQRSVVAQDHRIANEMDAISVALDVTGFGALRGFRPSAHHITVERDNTPFVWKELIGASAWSVQFDNVSLSLKSAAPGFMDAYKRRFIVLLLEDTGRVWSVRSVWGEPVPDLKPEPSTEVAEAQMRPEKDVYVGLPSANPRISFLDGLNIVLTKGVGSPFMAKEIDAVYVMESEWNSEPRPVWAITLRGIPPMPVSDPSIPVWKRNRMRNLIDVNTGKLLFATNSPQPR